MDPMVWFFPQRFGNVLHERNPPDPTALDPAFMVKGNWLLIHKPGGGIGAYLVVRGGEFE